IFKKNLPVKMKLKFVLVAERITRLDGQHVAIFPPGSSVPLGVGRTFAGKFVTPLGSPITAHQEYTQLATAPGTLEGKEGVISVGESCVHISTECGDKIVLFYSFELLTLDPSIPLTAGPVKGQVLSARLNGNPARASVKF